MNVNRRFVLKGLALSSVAGLTMGRSVRVLAGPTAAPAASAAIKPVLALVTQGVAKGHFLQGATATGTRLQVETVGRDPGFLLDFERLLRGGQPMRVIGLLDDASATLVVDMARSAGARMQWLGQHTAEDGVTRHDLLTTAMADGYSRRLTGSSRLGGGAGQWVTTVGYLLASLGTRPTMAVPLAPASNLPVTGSFVSFSIEV